MPDDLTRRASKIKLLFLDVDGVLTDGRIVYGDYGDELKFFDVQDGLGLVLWRRLGLHTVLVTSKKSRVNARRAKEVRASKIYQNVRDKRAVFRKVLRKFRLSPEEVCCIADDLVDLGVLGEAGLAVAVANGSEDVRQKAHLVTSRNGGRGAVRETIELVLKAQGRWAEALQMFVVK